VSVELFVEILNRYVYYFDQENEAVSHSQSSGDVLETDQVMQVTTKYLNGLIELVHSNLNTNENSSSLDNPRRHFQRTLDYIAGREYAGVETRPK
jgi:vacuolar protein sorting-associated protein 35